MYLDHFSFNSNKLSFPGTLESRIRNSIFQLILRPSSIGGQRDGALNFAAKRREATSGIVYIIMRQLREQALYIYIYIGSKKEKKNANTTEDHRRVADEGTNHLDSRAIKVRLRKPTKRLTLGKSGI